MPADQDMKAIFDEAQTHFTRGVEHFGAGRLGDAESDFQHALEILPNHPDILHLLGVTRQRAGDYSAAVRFIGQACAINPSSHQYHRSLGVVYQECGRVEMAVKHWELSTALQKDAALFSHMLLCAHYLNEISRETLFNMHRAFDRQYCSEYRYGTDHSNPKDSGRKLKIGYVSVDFRQHLGGYFLRHALERFDRDRFEVYVYHVDLRGVVMEDDFTAHLRTSPLHWRTLSADDEALAQTIRADGIDILVDLCGHSGGNRLLAFARKPAPIQMTWLGYPNTTGMTAMDYRLVDSVSDPEGEADAGASEKLIRLEGGFLCFSPPDRAPPVDPSPARRNGVITFGSLNRPEKVPEDLLRSWGEIVRSVPGSRLFLKGRIFDSPGNKAEWQGRLQEMGVPVERQVLMGYTSGHLEYYGEIDIALDTFPYNGTITTFDALWMGVPVVTQAGDRHVARVGASILSHIGLGDLVAFNRESYVRIANILASDLDHLVALRAGMRSRLLASPLGDAERFIRYLEVAYRTAWGRWCAGLAPEPLWIRRLPVVP